MNRKYFIWIVLGFIIIDQSFQANISPKLDFNESESNDSNSDSNSPKVSPKIQGVRVTIDTSNINKSTESISSEDDAIDSQKRHKSGSRKTVGVRTDVTIELSDENGSNQTSTEVKVKHAESDDDASVPIFKGKNTGRRTYVIPNEEFDRGSDEPRYGPPGIFHGTDDEHHSKHDSGMDWSNFTPLTGVWTTETNRKYHPVGFKPSETPYRMDRRPWKSTCLCEDEWVGNGLERQNFHERRSILRPPPSKTIILIDDKVDYSSMSSSREYGKK